MPFYLIAILYSHYDWALALLVVAALTDGLDGLLARTLNQKTAVGAYFDPIADKLLLSSSFVVLALAVTQWRWLELSQPVLRDAVTALTVFSGFHYSVVVARRLST